LCKCAWLIATSGGKPEDIHVAIEVPHGAIVETLLDRRCAFHQVSLAGPAIIQLREWSLRCLRHA
jgi:hypothetical protein